jgi:nuclear pore complex protein Nup205
VQLESGIFTLNDKQYRANKDFIAESTFLSDTLDCSEYYAAGLINQARPTPSAENGLIVFHNERAALISSLEAIWNGALSKDDVIRESGLQAMLLRETGELTRGKGAELSQGSSAKGWINKILSTIDQLAIEANSLRTSLTQALPISTALTFGKPATKSKISFSDEITEMRIIRLELERHSLGQLLYRIAMARQFTAAEILSVTTWLANVTVQDGAAVYILTTLLALLDTSGDYEYVEQVCLPLFYDRIFINSLNTLVTTKTWQVESLRSAVLLQWSLFLVGGSRYLPEFQTEMDIYEEDVERMIIEAVEGGVLTFLGRGLLSFKSDFEMEKLWGVIGLNVEGLGGESHVETRFQVYVTAQVESLVVAFITNGDSVLRKLKFREEDVVFSSHRGGGRRASRGGLDDRPTEQQHHLESLFLLVATIYYNAPDSGLKFWTDSFNDPASSSPAITSGTGGRHTFLRWGAECKAQGIRRAYYEMLASLSTGCRCAVYAFEFFSSNGNPDSNYQTSSNSSASWTTLFGALEYYSSNLSDQPSSMGSNINESVPTEISPDDTALLISFAKVLRQVVTYSDLARATLYDSQRYQPIATIFGILRRQVSIELKASLFGALAAFCRAGGTFGVDVARRTWSVLEQSQILPTMAISQNRDARGGVGLIGTGGGILRGQVPATLEGGILSELEEVEVTSRTFPGSMAFIDLLSALIHTPSPLAPLNRGAELDSKTIPDNLGIPYRTPGIDPYVRFVLDDVLLKSGQREYSDSRERWQVTSKSLAFVEKCLASYDLSPIITATAAASSRTSTGLTSPLSQLVLHPGFDILLRLLSGGRLLEIIVTIIVSGVDALDNNLAGTPLFANCLLRCMRIVRRTFELQSAFLEVVLPSLVESNVQLPQEKIGLMKNAKGLEQHLMYAGDAVAQIALLVSSTEDEIALIAVQILAVLAETPLFDAVDKFRELSKLRMNRLVGFLESSPETLRIKQAFAARLEAEISQSELELDDYSLVEGADYPQAIRSAILDLLLANTQSNRPGPNVAHLLLGFNVHSRTNEMEIDEPSTSDSPITCLHITLDLLSQNTVHETDDEDDSPGVQLISRHPTFTAKCYQLIRQLCLHEYTSAAVSRYLRTRQQFFVRHCLALPFRVPVAFKGDLGEVNYNQGLKVITSSAALCGILESEAWILESTALELNVLASSDDKQRVLMLVGALFGTSDILEDDLPDFERERLEQSSPRILEIFYAFDFTWFDAITPNETRLRHFAEVRFDSCLRTDANGCDIYDFDVLLSLLGNARRELQGRGALNTLEQQAEAKLEMKAIYENLVIENHRRAIQFSRYHGLRAWRSVLDITLAKAFHLLPSEGRHQSLLDLMDAILPPIAAQQTDQPISELLSGAAVLIMTKLRDEGARASVLESSDSLQSISPERLQNILRAVIQAILQPGVSPVVRGNLYAVMLNYIQYSNRLASTSPALSRSLADDSLISNVGDDLFSLDGGSTLVGGASRRSGRRNALESGNLAILQSAIDRLLPVICKDAAAGHEVWRTVAFTVLDAIVLIAEEGRAMSKLLSILTKQGYLQSFVGSLKDAEVDLLEALKPDPGESISTGHHARRELIERSR